MSLTPCGRDLRARAAGVPRAVIDRLGMGVDELESLQDLLSEVITHAKTAERPPRGRQRFLRRLRSDRGVASSGGGFSERR